MYCSQSHVQGHRNGIERGWHDNRGLFLRYKWGGLNGASHEHEMSPWACVLEHEAPSWQCCLERTGVGDAGGNKLLGLCPAS